MSSAHPISDTSDQRTWTTIPGSFIMTRNPPEWPWFSVSDSYVTFPEPEPWCWFPPAPAPEPQRAPLGPGDLRAALLHAADCLDASLDAQVDGDEAELLRNLETVRGYVSVAIDNVRKPSSEYLSVH
jgi:hypothetical protein